MNDDFAPPAPQPGTSASHRRRRRARSDGTSPHSDAMVPRPPPSAPSAPALGREVRDSELFDTQARAARKKSKRKALGREVRDSELFSSELGGRAKCEIGREVRDNELFGSDLGRPRKAAKPVIGREIRDSELFGTAGNVGRPRRTENSGTARRREKREAEIVDGDKEEGGSTRPRKKRKRRDYRDTRALLESDGVSIKCRDAAELLGRYDALPWRVGRKHPESRRLGENKRLTELCMEQFRARVVAGRSKGLEELPDDFVFALIAHDSVKAEVLVSLEERHPSLAPVLEAGWARIAVGVQKLPEEVDSWRELYELKKQREMDRMEEARARVRQSYEESAMRNQRRVVSMPRGTEPPVRKRRRVRVDPSFIPPPSLLTRLRNEHRRDRRRR